MKVAVVYWSGTGNTEEMANLVAEGVKSNGNDVDLFQACEFSEEQVSLYDAFAFGCPSMGAEDLEDSEFLPMWESVKDKLVGKSIVLFGSYGWGDGEWMETWKSECVTMNLVDTYICCERPDSTTSISCVELGKALV